MKNNYDNGYYLDNVYGHVLTLLSRHLSAEHPKNSVHLDLGCGYGRIAEALSVETKLHYLGLDLDSVAIKALNDRGLEAYCCDLSLSARELKLEIKNRLAGRLLASISLIDVLEHVVQPSPLLLVVRELLLETGAVFVLSVPNIAHRDVGFKLAFGRYDVRATGILDFTHFRGFTESGLKKYLAHQGLHAIDRNDVFLESSDQAFPASHAALSSTTLLGSYLRGIRGAIDNTATVNQLVAACLAGPLQLAEHVKNENELAKKTPFLSVVTRTQGRRSATLRDVLLSLAAQSCDDFELIIVGHKLDVSSQLLVERLIEDVPQYLRDRIRFIRVERGNRTAPLNEGFSEARGEYVAILDDDDLPFAHWVETFKGMAKSSPGCVLRVVAVKQECDEISLPFGATAVPRTLSGFIKEYPSQFDFLAHLRVNQTPPIALAFPRSAFSDLNINFDESLTTTEDWDFLMRTASICGVASSNAITCIYRWWNGSESSRSVHSQEEWVANHHRIFAKLDSSPMLMPAGITQYLRALMDKNDRQAHLLLEMNNRLAVSGQAFELANLSASDAGPRTELIALLKTRSWRVTRPLREIKRALKRLPKVEIDVAGMSPSQVVEAIKNIRASASWRVTAPLRRLRGEVFSR